MSPDPSSAWSTGGSPSSGGDRWSVYRIGTASAVTTAPGQTPAYGLATDLAQGQWQNADQFNQFARDTAPFSLAAYIKQSAAASGRSMRDMALERAQNYQDSGFDTEDDDSLFEKAGTFIKGTLLGSMNLSRGADEGKNSDELYDEYSRAKGLLSKEEFQSFDEQTQKYLTHSVGVGENFRDLIGVVPDPVMTGLEWGYRGPTTAAMMTRSMLPGADNPTWNAWLSGDKWSQAWRESNETTFGNELVNMILQPVASEDTLDHWAKNNSLYQFTSFVSEAGVLWYADPLVIAGKGVGAAGRIHKNEMPLGEAGSLHRAMTQKLQREQITVRNPITRGVADWRAQRMIDERPALNEYLKTHTLGEAMNAKMAKKRTQGGAPIMAALHWANNRAPGKLDEFAESGEASDALRAVNDEMGIDLDTQGIDFVDLTYQMGHGDPKAYAVVRKLKNTVPEELDRILGPGYQTFFDAIDAVKTKANELQDVADDLAKSNSRGFLQWTNQAQLDETTRALKGYEDYGTWLQLMGTEADDVSLSLLAQVKAPAPKRWNSVEKRRNSGTSRFFMDNQYGKAHTVKAIPEALWLQKANTASMHKVDSGVMSLNRQAEQNRHFFGYEDPEALEAALKAWTTAPTRLEAYKTMHEYEETHLIRGAALHFGVSEDLVRAIFNKVNDERNRTIRGVLSGSGSQYSSAPSLAARIANAEDSSVSLLSRSEDDKTVRLQLMDGRNHRIDVTVPEAALVERNLPIDITQTPNYYTPIDTRQFYYELKRHKDMLRELDKSGIANSSAGLMEFVDKAGSMFNNLWKPAQLWRLGWPQRVLMDEGMRAMALFGPTYWLWGPGADAATKAVGNVPYHIVRKMEQRRFGKVPLGQGPVKAREMRESDPFARAEEVARSVQVPEVLWPKLNSDRYTKINKTAGEWKSWKRYSDARIASGEAVEGVRPNHPLAVIRATRSNKELRVFDAVDGRRTSSGFVIPVPGEGMRFNLNRGDVAEPIHEHNMMLWYEKNAELLSREGMRVVATPNGELIVGKWFNSKRRKHATQFLQYADEAYPNTEMVDLSSGVSHRIEGPDDHPFRKMVEEAEAEDAARDQVTLWRGSAEGGREAVYNPKTSGVDDIDWPDADTALTSIHAERGEYGRWWGTEEEAKFYAGDDGMVVAAEFRRGDFDDPSDSSGYYAKSGTRGKVQKVQTARGGKWLDLQRGDDLEVIAAAGGPEKILAETLDDLDRQMDSAVARVTRWITKKREFGGGYTTIASSDGKKTSVENANEGHRGQLFRGFTSSNKTVDVLSEGYGGGMSLARRQAQGHKTYHPPVFTDAVLKKGTVENKKAVLYFQKWADMVNDQIGNSPIWSRMLKGQPDAQIVNWLQTPEGAVIRREMMRDGQLPELWVNEHRAKLEYYVPSDELQRRLAKGRLEPSDFRKKVHDKDLPDVFGPDLEILDKRRGLGKFVSDMAEKIWTGLGTIPIDTLSRHPFAKAMYDMKMRSLIGSTDSKWLDDATRARMQVQARDYAMDQVKRTLWDLTDSTNFTDALRFIAPFWGAQQEAITKWLRIISDRPETVARFFNTQRAGYQNFVVIDEEGNPVERGEREGGLHNLGLYHPTDRVVVNIPPFMRKGPLGQALETIGSIGVPIGSANTVLQGEMPLMPSPGPMLTIPANLFIETLNKFGYADAKGATHDEDFVYRWLFPIGKPSGGFGGVMEQLAPGWGKRLMSAASGEDDVAKANLFMQTAREMYLDAERNNKPMPSNEDVARQARWVWGLRVVAGMTMPVQTEFRPKNQFFVDAAHKYQKEFGQEWFDRFLNDYGTEMASYATSSSNSIVDIPPTSEGMEEWSQNKRLIQKFPEWGDVIVSPDAYTDDFSYEAYKAQFDISLGPGDNRKLRDLSSPQERFARANERVGWTEFRQFQSAIDAELYARGLTNIQQSAASDLQQLKQAFVADLTSRNEDWRKAYRPTGVDIYVQVNELQQFAFNKEFDNRPDMKGLRQYLIIRDQVAGELDAYAAATGGSRSLQTEENGALRDWFYNQVGSLVQANPAFGEFYSRHLERDTLEQGSGGF